MLFAGVADGEDRRTPDEKVKECCDAEVRALLLKVAPGPRGGSKYSAAAGWVASALNEYLGREVTTRSIRRAKITFRPDASCMSKAWTKEATKHFMDSVPNFLQCAAGLKDGTTRCAQLLRSFDSEPSTIDGELHPRNRHCQCFHSTQCVGKLPSTSCRAGHRANMTTAASSQATRFRPSTDFGTSSATSGPCMTQLRPRTRRAGSSRQGHLGGQQSDPLEMMRFCATIHPVWAWVMARHQRARALAFADDGFVRASVVECLHILAELQTAFKDDAKLDICLPKCKLYIKGLTFSTLAEAGVHKAAEADPASRTSSPTRWCRWKGWSASEFRSAPHNSCRPSLPRNPRPWWRTSRSCTSSPILASTSSLSVFVTTRDLSTSAAPCPHRQWRIRAVGSKRRRCGERGACQGDWQSFSNGLS